MKLKTNLFQGKKPFPEEGLMIYTVNEEEAASPVERSRSCRLCLQFLKVIFYVLLLFFLLFLVWVCFVFVSQTVAPSETRGMCGTGLFYDYLEPMDSGFNSSEVDDMIMNVERTDLVINELNDFAEGETSTELEELTRAGERSVSFEETKDYVIRALHRQIVASED